MKLDYDFYKNDAVTVAKELLGKLLVRNINGKEIVCKIVETEAYVGPEDKGCHAYNNKKTKRTEVMFLKGGHAYVYSIYGIHFCFNIVTNKEEKPEAVFIRAVEPLTGIDIIKKNRKISSKKIVNLTNGPGKLAQSLSIDKGLNGYNLISGNDLYIKDDIENSAFEIIAGKRINIDYAQEYKDKLWRFYIKGNPFVSI